MPKCSYLKLFLVNHRPDVWRCCSLSLKWAYTHSFLEIQSSFALDIAQAKKSTGTLLQQPVMSKLQGYNYLFLLSKQKAAYSWAQLFEKEKRTHNNTFKKLFLLFSWNEGTMTMTTQESQSAELGVSIFR